MRRLVHRDLEAYSARDWIGELLTATARQNDEKLVCQRWLAETPAKRLVFAELYGDLLNSAGIRILDVGGGLSSLTRLLAERHNYELVDFMAHDAPEIVEGFCASGPSLVIHQTDWFAVDLIGPYDVVIANDLFPNVDQRLELFLRKFLPVCREVRLSLTYYNEPRFYLSKRIDADEILCMLAWNGRMTRLALEPFVERICAPSLEVFNADGESLFPNKRQVCLISLAGNL